MMQTEDTNPKLTIRIVRFIKETAPLLDEEPTAPCAQALTESCETEEEG